MTPPRRRWTHWPPPLEGAMWMSIAAFFWMCNNILIRPIAADLPPVEMQFLRCLFSALLFAPYIFRVGIRTMRTRRFGLYLLRAGAMAISMISWIYAVVRMPVNEAVSLSFTAPLFATMFAALILREKVRVRRWSAVVIGFIGALVIIRPGFATFNPASIFVLLNAVSWASAIIMVRILARTESATVIVAYMFTLLTAITAIPAALVWVEPTMKSILLLLVLSSTGLLGHLASTRALSVAETSVVAPVEYLQLPLTAVAAYFLFAEVPNAWTLLGVVIIIAAVVYISHREAVRAREIEKTEPSSP
ncbi:MAG: DMT family transporter [Alphaproteobacteria bacterium]